MSETIEERLLREELELYNDLVDKIYALVTLIINQIEIKLPDNHRIVRVGESGIPKVAWTLYYDNEAKGKHIWLTTEGYIINKSNNLECNVMYDRFRKISKLGEKVDDIYGDIETTFSSKQLKFFLKILEKFYISNQMMINNEN